MKMKFGKVIIEKNFPEKALKNKGLLLNPDILSVLTRDQLRDLAEIMNVKKGRNKTDTIFNIIGNERKFKITEAKIIIGIEIEENITDLETRDIIYIY